MLCENTGATSDGELIDVWLRGFSNWLCALVMGFDSSPTHTSLEVTLCVLK